MVDREARYRDGNPTYEATGSSGNTYYLSKNSTAARERGEVWSCSCMAWIIQKKMPCKHLLADKRVPEARGHTGTESKKEVTKAFAEYALGPTKPVGEKERASQVKIAKREEYEAKKVVNRSKMRYGFQLAHHYTRADFKVGRTVVEVKYDGELGMLVDGRLMNRSGNDITNRFPEIESTDKAVLVGEVCILDSSGMSIFRGIQERATDDPLKIRLRSQAQPATFIAFDILEDRNLQKRPRDLQDSSFETRRRHLEDFLKRNPLKGVQLIEQIEVDSDDQIRTLLEKMRELGGEGFMVKDLDASYRANRNRNWLKVKTWQEEEFDVIRFEDTGIGHGFVIYIKSGEHEQRVVCNGIEMEKRIRAGHKRVEIKFLSKGPDGAMRFPSLRRLM